MIQMIRVDYRLLHGQVAVSWTSALGADCILLVSARPWGTYRVVFQSWRYKVKQITILPGARLSLQYHHHRSEHWVVVQGTATVEVDGTERRFHEGESVFVPKGAQHRLSNPGKIPLEIVEVQCGEYLGEDDIVRISDDFRR